MRLPFELADQDSVSTVTVLLSPDVDVTVKASKSGSAIYFGTVKTERCTVEACHGHIVLETAVWDVMAVMTVSVNVIAAGIGSTVPDPNIIIVAFKIYFLQAQRKQLLFLSFRRKQMLTRLYSVRLCSYRHHRSHRSPVADITSPISKLFFFF